MNDAPSSQSLREKIRQVDLRFYSWVVIKLLRSGILLFVLLILSKLAVDLIEAPYNWFLIGIGICAFGIDFFNMVRANVYRSSWDAYDLSKLSTRHPLLDKVMINLDFEINKFENGSNYYFRQVSAFKYNTVVLSGILTIILGLDLSGLEKYLPLNYTLLSKNIALVIGAVITAMTTMYTFWNLEKYWLQNKIILQRFRQLREEIELADKKKPLTIDEIEAFSNSFKEIKFNFYKYWEGVMAERNKQ